MYRIPTEETKTTKTYENLHLKGTMFNIKTYQSIRAFVLCLMNWRLDKY